MLHNRMLDINATFKERRLVKLKKDAK